MALTLDDTTIGRRFLQARRRGPDAVQELVGLLADDAVCVEALGNPRVIHGADAIAAYLRERPGPGDDADGLQIIKHVETEDGRIAGYWRRVQGDGVVAGRDVITVAHGRVVRLHVEVLGQFA